MENVKIEFLRNIAIFSTLTDRELLKISGRITIKEFSKNETILREEETNKFMYIILAGKAKVVQATEQGKEIIFAIHRSEDFFGELSLIDGKTSNATVMAMEESLIAIISKENFYTILFSQHKVLENLLRILCARLRESWKRIHILNFREAPQRIKMLFTTMSGETQQEAREGKTIGLKLTHQEIADMSGLTRETVTRVLSRWQKDGLITVSKNKYISLDHRFFQKI